MFSPCRLWRETHNIWAQTEEVTGFVHIQANLQKTSTPRATSGSDHQLSVWLGSIRGWILPSATPPTPQRLVPEGFAAEREGGRGACENSWTQCYLPGEIPDMYTPNIQYVRTKAAALSTGLTCESDGFYELIHLYADILKIETDAEN